RADAAATLADVELRRVQVDSARAELLERQRAAADARKNEQRQTARAERTARWAGLRSTLGRVRAQFAAAVPVLVGAVAMGAPILIGWNGQLQTARVVLHLAGLAWVYPVALEGGAWWLAYLMHRAIAGNRPTGRLRVWMWLLALLAAGMNFWHGVTAYGPIGGAGLALSSLLGIGLWELTAGHARHAATGATARQARTTLTRWARFPLLSIAAVSIAATRGAGTDQEAAWQAGWTDRYGVGPDASRRDRRLARLIIRAQWESDREAARRGDLVIVSGVILRTLPDRRVSTPDDRTDTPVTPMNQQKLSVRGTALLERVRAAIVAGTLPETPSAKAITRQFGGRVQTAIEVREYLAGLHALTREEVA
ncbi:MAG TPA: DUF2637 domain-containing protein, partial [Pseudonocardiaceae bacterium]|nr:DUF2637 domain-containing protein [Pseudonocardiaceae bacterium]